MILASLRTGELLTSDRGPDGDVHARYPTATRTLCGLPTIEFRPRGRRGKPTCEECVRAAAAMDGIDSSLPDHWRAKCGRPTKDGRTCQRLLHASETACHHHRGQVAA